MKLFLVFSLASLALFQTFSNSALAQQISTQSLSIKCQPTNITSLIKILEKEIKQSVTNLSSTTVLGAPPSQPGVPSSDQTVATTVTYSVVPRLSVKYSAISAKNVSLGDLLPKALISASSDQTGKVNIEVIGATSLQNPCPPVNATIKVAGSVRVAETVNSNSKSTTISKSIPLLGKDIIITNIPQTY